VTLVVGASANKRLLRRRTGRRIMRWGVALLVIGGLATVIVPLTPLDGPIPTLAAVMLFCLGQPLIMPNAVAAVLEPLKHMAGTASALMGVVQMLCGALGGYVVNALYDGTPFPMGAVMFGSGLGSAAILFLLRRA
jgi:MFS transporter, DHA1 family, multidrug resistance protein